jgi:predicted XRE-type DNA-binding protein
VIRGKIDLSYKPHVDKIYKMSRAGTKWTKEEDDNLLEQWQNKQSIAEIAMAYQRTEWAIKSRIMLHAINMMKTQNITIEQASEHVSIPVKDLEDFMKKQNEKQSLKESIDEVATLLKEIHGMLKHVLKDNSDNY